MKIKRRKKKLTGGFLVAGFLLWLVFFTGSFLFGGWDGKNDFLLVSLGKDELHVVNFSPARGAVNWYVLDAEINLLVPENYGWYPVNSLAGLLLQENKANLFADLLFINFGLVADQMTVGKFEKIESLEEVLSESKLGLMNSWKLKVFANRNYNPGRFFMKEGLVEVEAGKKSLDKKWWLGNWVRDISEAETIKEDLDIEILNGGAGAGAALRAGEVISMAGLNLLRIDNLSLESEENGNCRMEYSDRAKDSVFLVDFVKVAGDRVELLPKDDLETDLKLVIGKDCFLNTGG